MIATDTDVESLINSAYSELDCIANARHVPHGGDVAAFNLSHDCAVGYLCENHLQHYLEVQHPHNLHLCTVNGYIGCNQCGKRFPTVDAFRKVFPL